jgi:type II secretory pathway pseudopilin PulG
MTTSFPPTRRAISRFAPLPVRRRRSVGFTLMEIIVVMCIMMLMIGIGVASFSYFSEADPFEEPAERLRRMSKQALQMAVIRHQGMTIAFDKTGFGLLGSTTESAHYDLPDNMKMEIFHWGGKSWEKAEGQIWPFGEQGICEPIKVRFLSEKDSFEIAFHPLTGSPLSP